MKVVFSCVRLCYVQSLTGHKSPVNAVSASETTGDIATVCDSGQLCFHVLSLLSFQIQCWGKLLLKVMRYNILLLPKKVTSYVT